MPLNGPDESNIKQVRSFSFGHSTEDAKLNKIGSFQVAAIYLIELNGSERHLIDRPHKRRIHIFSQWEDFEMTNQEIARAYYEARIRGNSEEFWRDHVSDNIGYHLPAHTEVGGEFRGKPAVQEAISAIFRRSENTFKSEILDVTSSDRHTAVLVRATACRNGKLLD